MQPHWRCWPAALAAAATLAACAGQTHQSVAHLSSSTTTNSRSVAQPVSGERSPLAYARCMRSHGVPSFPDPSSTGASTPGNLDPSSPQFQAASQACRSLQPAGRTFSTSGAGSISPRQQAQLLAFAKCMRSHGVPSFADPTARGLTPPAGIDPNSSAFQSATQSCHRFLPGVAQGGLVTSQRGGGS
jgi:hypothetical protein